MTAVFILGHRFGSSPSRHNHSIFMLLIHLGARGKNSPIISKAPPTPTAAFTDGNSDKYLSIHKLCSGAPYAASNTAGLNFIISSNISLAPDKSAVCAPLFLMRRFGYFNSNNRRVFFTASGFPPSRYIPVWCLWHVSAKSNTASTPVILLTLCPKKISRLGANSHPSDLKYHLAHISPAPSGILKSARSKARRNSPSVSALITISGFNVTICLPRIPVVWGLPRLPPTHPSISFSHSSCSRKSPATDPIFTDSTFTSLSIPIISPYPHHQPKPRLSNSNKHSRIRVIRIVLTI